MKAHHSLWGVVAAIAWVPSGAAADKASLACIQASDEGQTARDQGNLLRARELFAQCSEPKCPSLIRRDCTSWLEQVQLQIPTIVLSARDLDGRDLLDTRVSIDGQPLDDKAHGAPIEMNPGPHIIRWEHAGDEPREVRVALRSQEKNRVIVATFARSAPDAGLPSTAPAAASSGPNAQSEPKVPAGGSHVAAYVLGGIGLVGLATFTYVGLRAKHDSDSLHQTCAPGCASSDVTALKTKLVVADVALGVGVAGLAAAAVVALVGRSPSPANAWNMGVAPMARGARADVEVRF
jgi:hypothetical protein